MKHILEIFKSILATIAKLWKVLVGTLFATLFAIVLAFLLRKFPGVRVPTGLAATSIFLVLLLWLFPKWQVRSVPGLEAKDRFDRENEARKTLSQILGGLILLIGFYFTWQNLQFTRDSQRETERIATEGQITDRFAKAIAQLGDTKLEIRLGGIYALERIAKDSPKDHWPIMEVLTAYVREHAKITKPIPKPPVHTNQFAVAVLDETQGPLPKPATDIQIILTVIGRRTLTDQEPAYLDLHETDLGAVDLAGASLEYADLRRSNLTGAILYRGNLSYANLRGTALRGAHLGEANLSGARLSGADLTIADLEGANLTEAEFSGEYLTGTHEAFAAADLTGAALNWAVFRGANLFGANLSGADLSNAEDLTTHALEKARGDAQTQLPKGVPRPKSWQ